MTRTKGNLHKHAFITTTNGRKSLQSHHIFSGWSPPSYQRKRILWSPLEHTISSFQPSHTIDSNNANPCLSQKAKKHTSSTSRACLLPLLMSSTGDQGNAVHVAYKRLASFQVDLPLQYHHWLAQIWSILLPLTSSIQAIRSAPFFSGHPVKYPYLADD